jgi:hypothetical protein
MAQVYFLSLEATKFILGFLAWYQIVAAGSPWVLDLSSIDR